MQVWRYVVVADPRDCPLPAALFSLAMLAGNYGKRFSLAALDALLTGAGFTKVRAVQTYGDYSLVSARKP